MTGVAAVRLPEDTDFDPQIAGALGAALFAHALYKKELKAAAQAG
jgi:activator of 2-hydroxyglutaryl-CoA dehydratase